MLIASATRQIEQENRRDYKSENAEPLPLHAGTPDLGRRIRFDARGNVNLVKGAPKSKNE
jgi:hypothetical protein